jgi:nitroreductase
MADDFDLETQPETRKQVGLAVRRLALLHHAFSATLVEELGEEKGRAVIAKAVEAYGIRIGEEAAARAREKGNLLTPENFEDDLPADAWGVEAVQVEGEDRVRVHHCPLAAEWLDWGDPALTRLYCGVDQAKMRGFNPEYEYIHVKNLLDGDPYCELVVRRRKDPENVPEGEQTTDDSAAGTAAGGTPEEMEPEDRVRWVGGTYSRDDLRQMDPVCLRALFRERVHHTIEVMLPPILRGEKQTRPGFGRQPRLILDVLRERGIEEDEPDILWGKRYIELADRLDSGETVSLDESLPEPFAEEEMAAVRKLIWGRRSIRDWIPDREIPDELIEQILEAGRAAPTGCNLDVVRFIVIRDPDEARMVWSDIPTPMDRCVLIVVCYDTRIYRTVGHDRLVPHNQLFDCAAAADHMCLMAHALGLGAVWLTRTAKSGADFQRKYGLPGHVEPALHIAVGWPAAGTIKSARLPLTHMRIVRAE